MTHSSSSSFMPLGFCVRDTLVAVDTGLLFLDADLVHFRATQFLLFGIHAIKAVAIAAFARIVGLHARPLILRQLQPVRLELLRGVDDAGDLAPDFLARLDLADHLVRPVLGHMAIGTDGAHAGAVAVVDGLLVFLIHVVAHLVTADAELQGIGRFHGGVETAPEEHAGEKTDHQQGQQRILCTRSLQHRQKPGFSIVCHEAIPYPIRGF